jgi:Fe-S cluster assembly protein SufD
MTHDSTDTALARRYNDAFRGLELAARDPAWLNALRVDALHSFLARGFPTRKDEGYRKLEVRPLFEAALPLRHPTTTAGSVTAGSTFTGARAAQVFVDGVAATASGDEPSLITGRTLADFESLIDPVFAFSACAKSSALTNLNVAFHHAEGVVDVPAHRLVEGPIVLEHRFTAQAGETHPRSLVVVRAGAEATLVELWNASAACVVNAATDIVVEAGATLRHIIVHDGTEGARVFASVSAHVARDAHYEAHTIALSDGLLRADVDVKLFASGATAALTGLTLARGQAVVDHRTRIVHESGHATSRQLYKSAFSDKSRGVFSGAVVFEKGAEKSDTAQNSKSLLLSPHASSDQKPELMIFADDVKASHGSTVGQLDEDALFYLRTRGVPKEVANAMLVRAFFEDLLEELPVGAVREHVTARVSARIDALLGETDAGVRS